MNQKRTYYHGYDFYPCMLFLDNQIELMLGQKFLTTAIQNVRIQFPSIGMDIMRKISTMDVTWETKNINP